MCAALKTAIYDAIEGSLAISYNDDAEILTSEVYKAIEPLIKQIQQVRLDQRVYFATKTKASLQRAIQSEQMLDAYIGIIEEVHPLQALIF